MEACLGHRGMSPRLLNRRDQRRTAQWSSGYPPTWRHLISGQPHRPEGIHGILWNVEPWVETARVIHPRGVFGLPSIDRKAEVAKLLLARQGWPSPLRVPPTDVFALHGLRDGEEWTEGRIVWIRSIDATVHTALGTLRHCVISTELVGAASGFHRWFCPGIGYVRTEYGDHGAMISTSRVMEIVDFYRPTSP